MSNYDPNQPGQPYNPSSGQPASNPNPYGENPYGQNPTPYGTNPYGQQAQPTNAGYGQLPGFSPVKPPTERPKSLQWAFLFIALAGVVNAVGTWLIFNSNLFGNMISGEWATFQEQFASELAGTPELANDPMFQQMMSSPEAFMNEFNSIMSGFVIVSIVVSLILYVLVGFFVGRGINAMRIIATILAVFSVLGLFASVTTIAAFADAESGMLNAVVILSVLLGVIGVVFAWLRPSSEYILQRRMARRAGYR